MQEDYLTNLDLSEIEREKISVLCPNGVAGLLGLIQAAPEDFQRYFRSERTAEIVNKLNVLVSDNDRIILSATTRNFNKSGAIIGQDAPPTIMPKYDVAERDRLFKQLQELRHQYQVEPSSIIKSNIENIEKTINMMLQS